MMIIFVEASLMSICPEIEPEREVTPSTVVTLMGI